jgi:hypothetical protein
MKVYKASSQSELIREFENIIKPLVIHISEHLVKTRSIEIWIEVSYK